MKNILITGGAGFIGSHLADRLIKDNNLTILDNYSSGYRRNIKHLSGYNLIKGDIGSYKYLNKAIEDKDTIYHLSANPDVRKGITETELDLKQETINTFRVLELMRLNDIEEIVFSSSSTIYGNHGKTKLKEDTGPCLPTSLYGAGKLASEGLVSAYTELYGIKSWIFRFANVVGSRSTHGVIFDFINKLKENPNELEVLGDGNQTKPYIHISDLIDGMLFGYENSKDKLNLFNISSEGTTKVSYIAKKVIENFRPTAQIKYTGGKTGWKGDIPVYILDSDKINNLGWKPKYTSNESIDLAIKEIINDNI